MNSFELGKVVDTLRRTDAAGDLAFPDKALMRELVDAACTQYSIPSPWSKDENCRFICEAIRYWNSTNGPLTA